MRAQTVAVFSTDSNPVYAKLAPLTAHVWREVAGYDCLIYFVGNVDPFIIQKSIEVGARTRQLLQILPGFSSASLAQNVRAFAALDDRLAADTYLLTTDVDMWPLSRGYFKTSQDWSRDLHLFNAFGMDPEEGEYPMCYIGALASAWRELLGAETLIDSRGVRDQPFVTALIKRWAGYPDRVQKMRRPLDPRFPGFHMRYTDRLDKVEWRDLKEGDVDSHLPRPRSEEDWRKLEELLSALGIANSWTRGYVRDVV